MSAISSMRAGLLPTAGMRVQPQPTGTASSGQAAFFRAALGQAVEPAKPEVAAPKPQAVKTVPVEGEMPSRLLRPGSLLDIRI